MPLKEPVFTSQFDIVLTAVNTELPVIVVIEFDNVIIFNASSDKLPKIITHTFDDNGGEHLLTIQLKNKTELHMQIDTQGNILSDTLINVEKFTLDHADITDFFNLGHCDYIYDDSPEVDQFWGTLGRNGVVKFPFSSPAYTWLIKNYQHWGTPDENS
jgi:hypothetical protein